MGRSEHPTESVLADYLDGELDAAECSAVEAHLEACAECRRELVDAVAVLEPAGGAERKHEGATRGHPWLPWLAATTALAASVAGIAVLRDPSASVERGERTRDEIRSPASERIPRLRAVAPGEGSEHVGVRPTFVWASAAVDRYSFRLLTEEGVRVWGIETSDTTVTLPANIRLEPGRTYYWSVDAMSGGIAASTEHQRFWVAP